MKREGVLPAFSDEGESADERYRFNSVSDLIVKGKRALKSGGGLLTYKKNLVKKIDIFSERNEHEPAQLDLDNEVQSMLLDNWIEEVLRFLALKTLTGDNTEPCQLLPGHAVGIAWKILMMNPSLYSKICHAMGNQHIFDHNPTDTTTSRVQEKHKVKRYNATLRAYESYFDQQPPALFWSFSPKEKVDDSFITTFARLCGCGDNSFTDHFAQTVTTKDPGMSPNMPLLV
jgi:hypothetical protein